MLYLPPCESEKLPEGNLAAATVAAANCLPKLTPTICTREPNPAAVRKLLVAARLDREALREHHLKQNGTNTELDSVCRSCDETQELKVSRLRCCSSQTVTAQQELRTAIREVQPDAW